MATVAALQRGRSELCTPPPADVSADCSTTAQLAQLRTMAELRRIGVIETAELLQLAADVLASSHKSEPAMDKPESFLTLPSPLSRLRESAATPDAARWGIGTPATGNTVTSIRTDSSSIETASDVQRWAVDVMANSTSFTTVALARMLHKIARDGRIDDSDEKTVKDLLGKQQQVWNVLLIILTLVLGALLPMLVEVPERSALDVDEASLDAGTYAVLLQAYALSLTLAFAVAFFQLFLTAMFYVFTTYLDETRDIVWFFFHFRRWLTFLNAAVVPLAPCLIAVTITGFAMQHGLTWCTTSMCAISGVTIIGLLVCFVRCQRRLLTRFRVPIESSNDLFPSMDHLPNAMRMVNHLRRKRRRGGAEASVPRANTQHVPAPEPPAQIPESARRGGVVKSRWTWRRANLSARPQTGAPYAGAAARQHRELPPCRRDASLPTAGATKPVGTGNARAVVLADRREEIPPSWVLTGCVEPRERTTWHL